ncbi:gamma-butyrobetaine dioxygenase-like [Anneissia japonica]|uniref:gamma-butyrobetaine dioxygenase-like n=1 Tax=Anneissia japonica TaxID=1529436 RepID=UPI0014256B9F|nr:gamma-butyrobetaine dioxygenase-like [Anneissia japonica]
MLRSLQRSSYLNILSCTSISCPVEISLRRLIRRNCRTQYPTKLHWVGLRNRFYLSTIVHPPKDNLITAAKYQHVEDETIYLLFNDETEARFPFVWLRDNCQCSECHDRTSRERILPLDTLDIDVKPIKAELDSTHQSIIVHWSDQHKSQYSVNWLRKFRNPSSMDPIDGLDVRNWGSEMTKDKVPTFSFHDIMSDESSLYSWLASLHTYGLSIVNNLGDDDKNLARLAKRVAHPKTTCFG